MILLTFRDLVYRKTRFIVVTILGAVVFALLFVMTGLVEQFNLEPYDTVDASAPMRGWCPRVSPGRSLRRPRPRPPLLMPSRPRRSRRWSFRARVCSTTATPRR